MNKKDKILTNEWLIFAVGMFLIGISAVLFVCLGKESIWTYHDQLDGELLTYIYQAKYLFQGNIIPEFMNGMGKEALTAPAPLFVLLYKVLAPFPAFVIQQYIVMYVGYIGLYVLLREWKVEPIWAIISGILFAYLPLLPVYGLSMLGIPLVLWAFYKLFHCQKGKQAIVPLFSIAIVGGCSSLVLSGFAILATVLLIGGFQFFKKSFRTNMYYVLGFVLLICTYVITNLSLISQVLGVGNGWISHKEEMTITGAPFFQGWITILFEGTDHAKSNQTLILILALILLVYGAFREQSIQYRWIKRLLLCNVALAAACALFRWSPVVAIRESIGGVVCWFQFDRLQWLCPGIWYAIFGLSLSYIWDQKDKEVNKSWIQNLLKIGSVFILIFTGISILVAGNWKANVQKILNKEYKAISWQDFYGEDVFLQIKDYIGRPLEDYRVVSLGIYPAAALYNGFYCLDGYSNNYHVEYKHKFREIISGELDKSEYLQEYFDDWGNRCFLFSSQIPGYFTVEKGGFFFDNLSLNTQALMDLGGEYILSAAFIQNAEEIGLRLLREEPFSTPESYYQIYLYQVEGEE